MNDGNQKRQALKIARYMGCSGVHKGNKGEWMPCADHDTLQRLSQAAESDSWLKKQSAKSGQYGTAGTVQKRSAKGGGRSPTSENQIGKIGGTRKYLAIKRNKPIVLPRSAIIQRLGSLDNGSPRRSKRKARGAKWERLTERGVIGLSSLDGGGIVSASALSKMFSVSDGKRKYLNQFPTA